MNTPNWQEQTICNRGGFTVKLSFEKEHEDAKSHFIDFCGWAEEDYEPISKYYWFGAKVTAYKGVIKCGSAYLGQNAYKNLKQVLGNNPEEDGLSGYMPQLIEEAIEQAHINLDE